MSYIIAVDFDGTLCENAYPEIGKPRKELIDFLKEKQNQGVQLILWTCRIGEQLSEAVDWCKEHGLTFDAVNDNVQQTIDFNGGENPRKVWADEYIDDKAVDVYWKLTEIEDLNDKAMILDFFKQNGEKADESTLQ